jgi:hypothetical protein
MEGFELACMAGCGGIVDLMVGDHLWDHDEDWGFAICSGHTFKPLRSVWVSMRPERHMRSKMLGPP